MVTGARSRDAIGRGVVSVLAAAVALHPVVTPDLWWHLASGRWILEHRAVPRTDPFSYTMSGHEWINLQWLGDVLLTTLYRFGGADLLVLAKAGLLVLVALLLYGAARRSGAGPASTTLAVTLAVLAGAERTMVRPEIASYVALALTLRLLPSARDGRRPALLALPGLALLWINLHSLAFLAPLLVVGHAALTALERRWPPALRSPELEGAVRPMLLAGGAAAILLLANPYGPAAWTFPLTLLQRIDGGGDAFARILEFAPPTSDAGDPALRFFWILLAATASSALAASLPARAAAAGVRPRGYRLPLGRLLSVVPFLALAMLARRNVPLFALAAAPVLAVNLSEAAERLRGKAAGSTVGLFARSLAPSIVALSFAVVVLAGASPALLGLWRDRGLGVTPGLFPEEDLVALDRSGRNGPLFHEMDFGGYITWRDPARRTFIDGRLEVAGPEWLGQWVQLHQDPAAWERARNRWNFDALLVQHSSAGNAAFLRHLLESGRWEPRHWSAEAALLVRRAGADEPSPAPGLSGEEWDRLLGETRGPEPHAGAALRSWTRPVHRLLSPALPDAVVRRAVRRANLCLTLGDVGSARVGYDRILEAAPHDPEAIFNRGMCDLREGRVEEARSRWRAALEHVPAARRETFERAIAGLPPIR